MNAGPLRKFKLWLSPRRKPLSDSHIFGHLSAEFDGMEAIETIAHDLGARLSVIAGPAAEPGNHPGREGEIVARMGPDVRTDWLGAEPE